MQALRGRLLTHYFNSPVGAGRPITALRLFFSRTASRPLTERKIQPSCPSPVFRRTISCVAGSVKTAKPSVAPATTPIRLSEGFSGSGGGGGGAAFAGSAGRAATAGGAGGRRDGTKIGRSRVAWSELRGTPQSGLPISGFSADCDPPAPSAGAPSPPGSSLRGSLSSGLLAANAAVPAASSSAAIAKPAICLRAV